MTLPEPTAAAAAEQGLFDNFSGYRTATDDDYQAVFKDGIVTLDTNVLLDLYRQQPAAGEQLFDAMERLGNNIWFPHQVLAEFHRNRIDAIGEPADAAEKAVDDLSELRQQTLARLRTWVSRVGLPATGEADMVDRLESGFSELIAGIQMIAAQHDPELAADTNTDPTLTRLNEIVTGRRGQPLPDPDHQIAVGEGKRRVAARLPPGYKDAAKEKRADSAEGAAGDYLVWEQFLREASTRQVDGLFVTRDAKEDWFWIKSGQTMGPRNELSEEYHSRTGRRLFMLRAGSWLHHMRPLLLEDTKKSEDANSVDAAVRALDRSDSNQEKLPPSWTRSAVHRLMNELHEQYPAQERAIQLASNNQGYVAREQIYEAAGFAPDRSLRGFTRPIERITRNLQTDGLLPYYAEAALTPRYDFAGTGTNRAVGFRLLGDFHRAYDLAIGHTESAPTVEGVDED